MLNKRAVKNVAKKAKPKKVTRTRIVFRFRDEEHHDMVEKAASNAGLSINAWMVQTTLSRARKELNTA